MNSTQPPSTARPSVAANPGKTAQDSIRVIAFSIAQYQFALPLAKVLRVVNGPTDLKQNQPLELVHVGNHSITVLNLQRYLAKNLAKSSTTNGHFLVVTRLAQGELCAISVDTPPDLVDLSPTVIRRIPDSYRQQHSFDLADFVAVISQGQTTRPIFLLSVDRALKVVRQ